MIHKSLQGKSLQKQILLTYNIHCARFTGSPNLSFTMETSQKKLERSWAQACSFFLSQGREKYLA